MSSANDARRRVTVYAVLRFDDYLGPDAEWPVTIKEILPTREEAEAEVRRLQALKPAGGVRYVCQGTRYYPTGRHSQRP